MSCIFVTQPPSCSQCLDSKKLQCLLNNLDRKVSAEGKKELLALLMEEAGADRRKKE